jgi:hypothetical protein
VTLGAGFFAWCGNIYAAAMLGVARRAIGSAHLTGVVDGAVMTGEASVILNFG